MRITYSSLRMNAGEWAQVYVHCTAESETLRVVISHRKFVVYVSDQRKQASGKWDGFRPNSLFRALAYDEWFDMMRGIICKKVWIIRF